MLYGRSLCIGDPQIGTNIDHSRVGINAEVTPTIIAAGINNNLVNLPLCSVLTFPPSDLFSL